MPCLRASSATFTPASASRRIEMIFSSLNRDFFIRVLRGENSTPMRSSESGGYKSIEDRNILANAVLGIPPELGRGITAFLWIRFTELANSTDEFRTQRFVDRDGYSIKRGIVSSRKIWENLSVSFAPTRSEEVV